MTFYTHCVNLSLASVSVSKSFRLFVCIWLDGGGDSCLACVPHRWPSTRPPPPPSIPGSQCRGVSRASSDRLPGPRVNQLSSELAIHIPVPLNYTSGLLAPVDVTKKHHFWTQLKLMYAISFKSLSAFPMVRCA